MNTAHRWLWTACLLAGVLVGCCPARPARTQESLKGYELYTWREEGQWYYALLEGTNRLKTDEEILTAARYLNGPGQLQENLKRLAPGQYVTWTALEAFPLPDEELVADFQRACRELELVCSVIR